MSERPTFSGVAPMTNPQVVDRACPFCGHDDPSCLMNPKEKVHPYRVTCPKCGCGTAHHGNFQAAWKAWTARPSSLQSVGEVERVAFLAGAKAMQAEAINAITCNGTGVREFEQVIADAVAGIDLATLKPSIEQD